MSWNHADTRNIFLKLKSKLGLYHVLLTNPKTSPEKHSLTVVERQQMTDIGNNISKKEVSCLKWTLFNVRRKVCVNFQTDTDQLNIIMYRYRNSFYLKDKEVLLKLTEHQSLLPKQVYSLSYVDIFYKRCLVLGETTVHNKNKIRQERMFFF